MVQANKGKYRELCKIETSIPIFSRDWWLDATAGDNWDVVLVENKGGEIQASLPFMLKKRYGFTLVTQPQLTQTLGPWIRPSNARYSKQLAQEKELLQALFDQLPPHDYYGQNWHYSRTNWLPLYWKGYKQTTQYTYRIEDLSDLDKVWDSIQKNSRKNVIKATEEFGLSLRDNVSIEEFMALNDKVYERQGISNRTSLDLVRRIEVATKKNKSSKIFMAVDSNGIDHGAMYLIWDEHSAYALMGGSDPALRNSGAISLCRWEAIKFAATVTKSFDFEGSMIEPVELSYRNFGTTQTSYFHVTKINSKILRAGMFLKGMI